MRPAAVRAATADERGVTVDTLPRDGATPPDDQPYRLPSPLQQPGEGLPVAPAAPRIPRALRAFNGMPPAAPDTTPPGVSPAPSRSRSREPQRTMRDLLLDAAPEEPEDAGLMAGLRSAWRRWRRPVDDLDEDGSG